MNFDLYIQNVYTRIITPWIIQYFYITQGAPLKVDRVRLAVVDLDVPGLGRLGDHCADLTELGEVEAGGGRRIRGPLVGAERTGRRPGQRTGTGRDLEALDRALALAASPEVAEWAHALVILPASPPRG